MRSLSAIFIFLAIQIFGEASADDTAGRTVTFPGEIQEKLNIPNGVHDPSQVDIVNSNYLEQSMQFQRLSIFGGKPTVFARIDHGSALNGPAFNTSVAPGGGLKLVWRLQGVFSIQLGTRLAYELVKDIDERTLINIYLEVKYRWDLSEL